MERGRLELLVLGPVQAQVGRRPVELGVRQQRFITGVLALEVNRLVTAERLIDLTWPDDPPSSARRIIHSHISRMRSALAEAGAEDVALTGRDSGYVLRCDPNRVDAHRFRELVAEARQCTDDSRRVDLLDRALGLWRGPVLGGTAPEQTLARLGRGLEDTRLGATEELMDARLRLGQHLAVVDELDQLVSDHPHRHRFAGQLILALYRAGRSADALATYRTVRDLLVDELGLDPPPELQQLELAILRDDPTLGLPNRAAAEPPPESVSGPRPPAQLPADLPTFTGRAGPLDRLISDAGSPEAATILAIDGMAGTGKTALAVHAAHRLAPSYPDGQLFLDLHGFTPDHAPVEPGAALDRLLRALGVPGEEVPPDVEDRAALYRGRLAGTKTLVLLDNARDEEHVRHLLPAERCCLTLITSRSRLTGLAHAEPLSLDVLPLPDAVALLARVTGQDHPAGLAEQVVELCGRLPLAIQIVAARLRSRPDWTLDHLAERLADQQDRLAELGSGSSGVEAAFQLSYQQLPPLQQRLFRLLGLHPRPELDTYAAAAIGGLTRSEARRALEDLVDRHVLEPATLGRYRLHDLLRAYATELAHREESEEERRAALIRLFDYYTYTAAVATDVLHPDDRLYRPQVPTPDTPVPRITQVPETAASWLDAERATLLAVARVTADQVASPYPGRLARILHRYLDVRSLYEDGYALHSCAAEASRRDGVRDGLAYALAGLGTVNTWWGRNDVAREHCGQALVLFQEIGDRHGAAQVLSNLGGINYRRGHFEDAWNDSVQALELFDETGDQPGQARVLGNLGIACQQVGRQDEALGYYEQALAMFRENGNWHGEANSLGNLGRLHAQAGRPEVAEEHYRTVLAIFRQNGSQTGQARALGCLGAAYLAMGCLEQAETHLREAIGFFRQVGNQSDQAEVLRDLGSTLLAAGRAEEALGCFQTAVDVSGGTGERYENAHAHEGLARCHRELGDLRQARRHRETALALFSDLGVPEADEVRARLAELEALRSPRPTE